MRVRRCRRPSRPPRDTRLVPIGIHVKLYVPEVLGHQQVLAPDRDARQEVDHVHHGGGARAAYGDDEEEGLAAQRLILAQRAPLLAGWRQGSEVLDRDRRPHAARAVVVAVVAGGAFGPMRPWLKRLQPSLRFVCERLIPTVQRISPTGQRLLSPEERGLDVAALQARHGGVATSERRSRYNGSKSGAKAPQQGFVDVRHGLWPRLLDRRVVACS
mmetsp:Transcript_76536/g.221203  ORF Transcript_76536/g.221203 Transcript_76536/m.221203 type:complete len:215 (-) Transcript_76536:10-654(-)